MKPFEYCEQRASDAGFDHLYRFIFRSDSERLAVLAVRALEHQFDELVEATSDADVAMTQLQWWTEEFERLYDGEPRHPITLAIVEANAQPHIERAVINDWLTATAGEIQQPVADDEAQWQQRQDMRSGTADRLVGNILGIPADSFLSWQRDYTVARRLARSTLLLGLHLRNGYVSLPLQNFESHGITPTTALDESSRPDATALVSAIADDAASGLATSIASATFAGCSASAPLLATASVLRARLDVMDRSRAEVLDGEVRVTALRQVLAARGAKVQAKKNAR